MKFVFPNPLGIYLHGTINPGLFDRGVRVFSHGYIRIERPMALALALLRGGKIQGGEEGRGEPCDGAAWGALARADQRPRGGRGGTGHDGLGVVQEGANLGWPNSYGCEAASGMVTPSLVWNEAFPPGGAAFYRGGRIPGWNGNPLIGGAGAP